MARTSNLTDFLTDVSSAIKQKTGDSAPIPASEFDTEILSIETAGNYQSKTLNITQNGNYNLLPDQEFDAISNVNISVSVSPVLQNKTITENGSYTADQNYDGLGTVIVNVPQTGDVSVKLFETEEQMQADTTVKEGDLAIVYRSEVKNATVDSKFQTATFPDTVVLDTALTNSIEVRYRAVDSSKPFDCWGRLDSSSFRMDCYTESGETRIQYTSSDGITYTRTDTTGNPVDFGTEIYYERPKYWNDAIGKFIQVGGSTFEGLFNYSPIISDEIVTFGSVKYKLPKAIINYSETVDFNNKINGLMFRTDFHVNNRANSIMKVNNYEEINGIRCAKSGSLYFIMAGYPLTAVITATNETRIAFTGYTGGTSNGNTTYVRKVDFDENGITNTTDYPTEQLPTNFEALSVKGQTYYWDISAADDTAMKTYVSGINGNTVTIPQRGSSTTTLSSVSNNAPKNPVFNTNVLKWLYAPTQLTLAKANELLPGKITYGKEGVVIGDGSVYNNLNTELISNSLCGDYNLNNLYYYENIKTNSREERYDELKNKIVKFNKSVSQTDKKIGVLKERINLNGSVSFNYFIVDNLSIGLAFPRDNNYEIIILDNNGETHYLYGELPENCGSILRTWYYNNYIYMICSDKTNNSIYRLYKCTNTDDIEIITEIICPDNVAYFIDNSLFYINNGSNGGSKKIYKFDLQNEISSYVDLPFQVEGAHYLSRINNVLTMCVYKLNDNFSKQTNLLQWNTNLELITNQKYTTTNTNKYIYNQYNVMAFRLNDKLYFSQYGYIYEADEVNHTYNYIGTGEDKSSGMQFIWASDNECLYTQELFTLFNWNEKNNITYEGIRRLNNFAVLTSYNNKFVDIIELVDVNQMNDISNYSDIVTIMFNDKNNICSVNPVGRIINIK